MAELLQEQLVLVPDRLSAICEVDAASIQNAVDYHERLLGASATVSEILIAEGTEIIGVPVYHKPLRGRSWLSLTGVPEISGHGAELSLFSKSPYPDKLGELFLSRVQFPTDNEIHAILANPQLRQEAKPEAPGVVSPYLSEGAGYEELFDYVKSHTKLLLNNCFF